MNEQSEPNFKAEKSDSPHDSLSNVKSANKPKLDFTTLATFLIVFILCKRFPIMLFEVLTKKNHYEVTQLIAEGLLFSFGLGLFIFIAMKNK
jgi:hypothetical protein